MNKNMHIWNGFRALLEDEGKSLISIYIPTHTKGGEVKEGKDILQFKNILKKVESKLKELEVPESTIKKRLSKASKLLDDQDFWYEQSEALAVFIGPHKFEKYRLPIQVKPFFDISVTYNIQPLLPLMRENGQFYLLALSREQVRLFGCTRYTLQELPLNNYAPTSMEEALKWDDPEKSLQYHSGGSSTGAPIFHGQGKTKDVEEKNLKRFFDLIDHGIHDMLDNRVIPLVLAGVDEEIGAYRKANKYPALIEDFVSIDPNSKKDDELRDMAYDKVKSHLQKERQKAIDRYHKLSGSDKSTTSIDKIIRAAHYKEIDALFLEPTVEDVWGTFDPNLDRLEIHDDYKNGDLRLINKSAIETLRNGGDVFIVGSESMSTDTRAAALLRF